MVPAEEFSTSDLLTPEIGFFSQIREELVAKFLFGR
jgi:hypothetical protein